MYVCALEPLTKLCPTPSRGARAPRKRWPPRAGPVPTAAVAGARCARSSPPRAISSPLPRDSALAPFVEVRQGRGIGLGAHQFREVGVFPRARRGDLGTERFGHRVLDGHKARDRPRGKDFGMPTGLG